MVFNSLEFCTFLAIVYPLYWILPFHWQNRMLLVAGYLFYGWWDVRFLFLIASSTAVDFTIGLLLSDRSMPVPQRWTVSLFLLGAALLFLCPDWPSIAQIVSQRHLFDLLSVDIFHRFGFEVLAATLLFVLAANWLIDRAADLPTESRARALILISVLVNLTFLGIFKYFNFFVDSAAFALSGLGMDPTRLQLHIVLPVGISFYTFQSLSYTIDIYRHKIRPTTSFWDFALFVAYFPPLVAGPIERARHLLPQLLRPRRMRLQQMCHGLALILLGLFKKVAIADGIAPIVDAIYASSGEVSQFDIAGATVLFAFQILCDFSGYSDIARGVSKLLGIDLIVNFNLPYFSQNPSEFWRRWHISLSSWLRDYLYISLGGNRRGSTYVNLMLTMLLGGLWHGAAWNYVLWGAYQGSLLCVHRLAIGRGASSPFANHTLMTPVRIGFFFLLTCYGWLLFRARTFDQISSFTTTLLGFGGTVSSTIGRPATSAILGMALLAALQVCDYRAHKLESFLSWRPSLQGLLYAALIFILAMGMSNAPAQFIYFQF